MKTDRGKSTAKAQARPDRDSDKTSAGPRGRGGARPHAGRKRIEIDLVELEKLCALQCTNPEIAAWFGCTERTIEKRSKELAFQEAMSRGRAKGRISIRRNQFRLLEAGNATIGIWLGKQYLGQRDITPIELSGPNGGDMKFSLEVIDAILSQAKVTKSRKRD
jgi:hypothetical protein